MQKKSDKLIIKLKDNINDYIVITGAKEHNLKNINISIPKNKFIVITGVSGSGKSSLAFDTIYAEGKRRYVDSLSNYAKRFIHQIPKPNVDSIDGLCPAISIEQRRANKNPRSTVGTITEIYNYVRLLYTKIAVYSPSQTSKSFGALTKKEAIEKILSLEPGEKYQILSPVVIDRKGEHKKTLEMVLNSGFNTVKINGRFVDLHEETNIELDKNKKHSLSIVIDRIKQHDSLKDRITSSIKTAVKLSDGYISIQKLGSKEEKVYSIIGTEVGSENVFLSEGPRIFSFNSPLGYCKKCKGLGYKQIFDQDIIIPDKTKSLKEGALKEWKKVIRDPYYNSVISSLCKHYRIDENTPYYKLSKKIKDMFFYGSKEEKIQFKIKEISKKYQSIQPFKGIIHDFEKALHLSMPDEKKVYEEFMSKLQCPECNGQRLSPTSLAYKVQGKNIAELQFMPIERLIKFLDEIKLSKNQEEIAADIIKEIKFRLSFLANVGLSYMSLYRPAATLSGGEAQRVHLATQIGSSLTGVLYVLDEPSIGLHQQDNNLLLNSIKQLKENNNTVIVVEHDRDTIEAADYVIDIGPGAGALGGEIIAENPPKKIRNNKNSLTGKYLSGKNKISVPKRRDLSKKKYLSIYSCTENNLNEIDLKIPLNSFICVSGVSGSGKSSLILKTLVPAIRNSLYKNSKRVNNFSKIEGVEYVNRIINVDQSPIGRTPRSNLATYCGVFSHIRTLFAETTAAKIKGYNVGRFSFNVKSGRCATCEGNGSIKIEMLFMPNVYIPCHVCNESRYNRETLNVRYRGKSIADVLNMTVLEALDLFENIPYIKKHLIVLRGVGLSYIRLGQPATTFSGGEAQRIKLAKELSKSSTDKTIYVLDEPSTGLHFADISRLLQALHKLVDQGNTVIIIEHNLDIIKHADYLIDIGPDGGERGGDIIAEGRPEEIVKKGKGYTAKFLAGYL